MFMNKRTKKKRMKVYKQNWWMKQRINSATTFYDPLVLTYKESLVAVYMKGKETNHVNACCQPNTSIAKKTNFKTGLNILIRSIILLKMSLIAAWNIRNPFFKPYGALVRLCSKVFNLFYDSNKPKTKGIRAEGCGGKSWAFLFLDFKYCSHSYQQMASQATTTSTTTTTNNNNNNKRKQKIFVWSDYIFISYKKNYLF
jgi:uncharacterized protein with LGFP repeats